MDKVLIVVIPNAVSNPRTMVVIFQNASFALSTMMGSLWFPSIAVFTILFSCDRLLFRNFGYWGVGSFVIAPENQNGELEEESSYNPFFSRFKIAN